MKLRNKRTGEIVEWFNNTDGIFPDSLAELIEGFEDYEEPKEHWAIDQFGEPINVTGLSRLQLAKLHRFGNDFPSEDATIEAIKKLEAWQRLKDKGFRFTGINDDEDSQELINQCGILCETEAGIHHLAKDEDFILLFGGEE